MSNYKKFFLALKLMKKIGNKTLLNIINKDIGLKVLKKMPLAELSDVFLSQAGSLKDDIRGQLGDCLRKAATVIKDCKINNIKIITYRDSEYPVMYKIIDNPPAILFVKGNTKLLNKAKAIAIIGTRDCTEIGAKIAFKIAEYFSQKQYIIVSGLANGIDSVAHKSTLKAKGKTIAVLTDVKNVSPKGNRSLAQKIITSGGLLLAENEPGSSIRGYHFVQRDRLQSALSLGVFPIETNIEGGTMHTVDFAKKQNRLIFCPDIRKIKGYSKDESRIEGIQKLIQEKVATPFTIDTYSKVEKSLKHKEADIAKRINWSKSALNELI